MMSPIHIFIFLYFIKLTFKHRSDLNLCISIKILSNSVQIELFIIEEFYKLKYCSTVVYMVPRA